MYAKGEGGASEVMVDGMLGWGNGCEVYVVCASWIWWYYRRGAELGSSMDCDGHGLDSFFCLIGGLGLCKDFYVPARDTGILDLK